MKEMRIGHGYDVHKLVPERKLIIGGVDIPYDAGLLGHSDADVLLHAIMDAVLGALGEGDIGRHFPDNSDEFFNADSMHLATRVKKIMDKYEGRIINIDATIILQKPKIAPYIEKMCENIAFCFGCERKRVNVKATTEEKLGFTGSGEGAAAHAVVMLEISA